MLFPEKSPDRKVMAAEGLVFHSFGTLNEEYYWQGFPFDKVKAERLGDREEVILAIEECKFHLVEIDNG
jgi:hypothetical protein